ncbi:DNA-binding response regulator [Streptomyces sp. DSM 118878]
MGDAARVEQALLQAGALIESTVSLHRRRSVASLSAGRPEGMPFSRVLESLIATARYTVCAALPAVDEFTDTTVRSLARLPSAVTVRVLCGVEVAESALAPLTAAGDGHAEIRVSGRELRAVVLVDGTSALVRAREGSSGQVVVVHDTATIRALELFGASAWSRGRSLADHLQLSPLLRSELARNVLELLRAGRTDEAAARELDVSLRTYRRYVAKFLRELDAGSRFQAGARAVELGLLSE